MSSAVTYPVRVDARIDEPLSRWMWLVKWFLLIPHYIVLAFLWLAFAVLSVVAFVAILFTGHYPRGVFDFNVGVLRWTWRVQYYAYGALGTDRYPPFSLKEEADYPAHLEVAYPDHLSRGLVLVKWWLLALPHYLVVGVLMGGLAWFGEHTARSVWPAGSGLISLLVLFAAVALAFTGSYPRSLYDLVLGLNRWVLRVAAYAALMTDDYPPFRLDMGGRDPGSAVVAGPAAAPAAPGGSAPAGLPPGATGFVEHPGYGAPAGAPVAAPATRRAWTGGRITSVVAGALAALLGLGGLAAGGAALWVDRTQRVDGFVTTSTESFTTSGFALTTNPVDLSARGPRWGLPTSLLGTVRIRAQALDPGQSLFLGIAPASAADTYLSGVARTTVTRFGSNRGSDTTVTGTAPATPPAQAGIWVASVSGTGRQSLTWRTESGSWRVVVMRSDGTRAFTVRADVGATAHALTWVATGLLIFGGVMVLLAVPLLAVPIRRAGRDS